VKLTGYMLRTHFWLVINKIIIKQENT